LPIGDKKKADILDLPRKKSHSQILCYFFWIPISIIIITFKVLFVIFLFCFFLNYDNNVTITVWNNLIHHHVLIFLSEMLFISWLFNTFVKNINNDARTVTQLKKSSFWVVLWSLNVESW
jgi:hypothetical protein